MITPEPTQAREIPLDDHKPSDRPNATATERLLQKSRSRIEALRARILLLLHGGLAPSRVAVVAGCARATVYRTVYRFKDLGEDGLLDRRAYRTPRKATADIQATLGSYVDSSPPQFGWQRTTWTLELLAAQLLQDTGVLLSPSPSSTTATRGGEMLEAVGSAHSMLRRRFEQKHRDYQPL